MPGQEEGSEEPDCGPVRRAPCQWQKGVPLVLPSIPHTRLWGRLYLGSPSDIRLPRELLAGVRTRSKHRNEGREQSWVLWDMPLEPRPSLGASPQPPSPQTRCSARACVPGCLGPVLLGEPPAPSDISKLPPLPAPLTSAAGCGHRPLLKRVVSGSGVEELRAGFPGQVRPPPPPLPASASCTQRTPLPQW